MSPHLEAVRKSRPRKLATAMRRALAQQRGIVEVERDHPAASSGEAQRFAQAVARLRHARQG